MAFNPQDLISKLFPTPGPEINLFQEEFRTSLPSFSEKYSPQIIVAKTNQAPGTLAADLVHKMLQNSHKPSVALATGSTMDPFYERLVKIAEGQQHYMHEWTTFNLDEYVGIPPEHPQSYRSEMNRKFFDHIGFDHIGEAANHYFPTDAYEVPYESLIRMHEGIHLCMLGIGRNGHIAFNEPGTSFSSRTRGVMLAEETRQANARFFNDDINQVPRLAVTMGISTILEAQKIMLVASGIEKLQAIESAFFEEPNILCPASALQYHPKTTVIIDDSLRRALEANGRDLSVFMSR